MNANVILGNNIDTSVWIKNLETKVSENIIVIDYDCIGKIKIKDGVIFLSYKDAKGYLEKFDSVCFYKSMYGYPGMKGKMSSLYKSKERDDE